MKTLALVICLLASLPGFTQVNFYVRQLVSPHNDSITQLVDHPSGNEVVRLFANPLGTGYQYGMIRERGDRVPFPSGERFFCFEESRIVTESLNQNRHLAGIKGLRTRRYSLNKTRLTLLDEQVDTLENLAAPLWRRWEGTFWIHPACQHLDQYGSTTLLALAQDSGVVLQAYRGQAALPYLSRKLAPRPPGRLAGDPWLKPVIATPDRWLLHMYWYNSIGKPRPWYLAMDTTGTVAWQRGDWDRLWDRYHPLGLVLGTKKQPLLGLLLEALDARSGRTLWAAPLYDIYINDPRFALESLAPGVVSALDIAPVLGGSYTAVLMAHHQAGEAPILYLLDDQGKVVYRYPLEESARLARFQERDNGFALVTETRSFLFMPR